MSAPSDLARKTLAQKSHFDREARNYDAQLTRIGRRNHDRKMEELDRILKLESAESVLEVGAGSGMHLEWIANHRPDVFYAGIDLSQGMLREARKKVERRPRTLLAVSDALAICVGPGAMDAGFAVDVVHHVPDPVGMFREMSAAVRPGGALAVLEPNWVFPVNLIYLFRPVEWGVFRSRAGNLTKWAKEGGWEDVRPIRLPIYFPTFPAFFHPLYGGFENSVGKVPLVRYFSTTVGVAGRVASRRPSTSPTLRSSQGV